MTDQASTFDLAYVPGATPGKWARGWAERVPDVPLELVPVAAADAERLVRDGGADAAILRLPVDRTDLHAIPLYTETTVVVVPKDHLVTAVDEVSSDELADELVLHPLDDTLDWPRPPGLPARERPATTADAVQLVAAGVGLLVVPQSLARLHHRRDLTYRPLTDAPASAVALVWREDATTELMEHFIGIVRGRTANSSRGPQPSTTTPTTPTTPTTATAPPRRGGKTSRGKGAPSRGARGRSRRRRR